MRLTLVVIGCLMAAPALADTMRCGRFVVSEGMSQYEVVSKCGDPVYQQVIQEPVILVVNKQARIQTLADNGNTVSNVQDVSIQEQAPIYRNIDRWTYHFGSGTLLREVDFENGVVIRIKSGARAL